MSAIAFGGRQRECVRIVIHGYAYPPSGETHDDNWLNAEVAVQAGAFRGRFSAMFQTTELEAFYAQLLELNRNLKGEARFSTLEEQLSLVLMGNGLGRIDLTGRAQDRAGIGNTLAFDFGLDQTQLQEPLSALAAALAAFPVR